MCRSSKPKPSGKTEDKYVPDCSLYRLIPYFGPVADFSVRQPVDQYLPLPFGLYRLHCPAADRRSAGCSAFSGFVDVRCDGLGDGGSGDQYDRYASGRYAAPLLQSVCGKEGIREGGIPSSIRLGQGGFLRYLAAMVVVHHFLFFMLESLSWAQLFHTLVRLVVSSAVTVGFIWLLARLFTTKLTVRL